MTGRNPTLLRRTAVLVAGAIVALAGSVVSSPSAEAATSITLVGHGWGHGRGMGQWGAYGYAVDYSWSSAQILDHFYGGTGAGLRDNETVSVQLTAWTGKSMSVTSGGAFKVGTFGTVGTTPNTLIEIYQSGGKWLMLSWEGGCNRTAGPWGPYEIGTPTVEPIAPADAESTLLTLCGADRRTYRGSLRVVVASNTTNVVNDVPMESYLRGVVPRESPASWGSEGGVDPATGRPRGFQALAAQAVAARSYAFAENRSPGNWKTCDTTSCQVYGGAYLNGVRIEDSRTDAAIAGTAGVVRMRDGVVVRTEFSSSTGGWTAGGAFPAVEDLGDARSPYHNWTVTLGADQIQAKYPSIGQFTGIRVTKRNGIGDFGGRVDQMQVIGTVATVTVSGSAFQAAFGLRSTWFASQGTTQLTWMVRQTPSAGGAEINVPFGAPGDRALGCDFDGDGDDGVTVYERETFYGRNSVSGGTPDIAVAYGDASYVPVCGDWDGAGGDGIGVYVNGWWYLRNSPTPGPAEIVVNYGYSGAIPVVGDWDGNGTDGIGVYDRGNWYLRQTATAGPPEIAPQYGIAGYVPVVADWDGIGGDGIGVYVNGGWYLRNGPSPGPPQISFAYGAAGYRPVVGDWDGVGPAGVGVVLTE